MKQNYKKTTDKPLNPSISGRYRNLKHLISIL